MATTVLQMLSSVGAYTDIDTSTPTGSDLQARVKYMDLAQLEWAGAYNWDTMRKTSALTFALSATSIGIDSSLNQLMSQVIDMQQGPPIQFNYIYPQLDQPKDRFNKLATDNYVYITGNPIDGMAININPPLASGASLVYDWIANPSTLATLTDVTSCPRPDFIIKRTIAYVLESRSDPRFPQVKVDADRILKDMIVQQDDNFGGRTNQIRNRLDLAGYRIGEV